MRASKLREPFVFFIDECLGSSVIRNALTLACLGEETVKMYSPGTPDDVWLPEAGEKQWVCFSKDRRMMSRPNELRAIIEHKVGLFTLGEARAVDHASLIVNTLPIVRRAAGNLHLGFVARIEPDGGLKVCVRDGVKLGKSVPIKPNMHEWPRCNSQAMGISSAVRPAAAAGVGLSSSAPLGPAGGDDHREPRYVEDLRPDAAAVHAADTPPVAE